MKNFQFIFLRLTAYLVAGILLAFSLEVSQQLVFICGGVILCFYIFSFYRARKALFPDSLAGISTLLTVCYLGFTSAFFSIPVNDPMHYIHQDLGETDSLLVSGRITEELKANAFSNNYIFETESLVFPDLEKPMQGKVLLNIQRDTRNSPKLQPGDMLLIPFKPEEINSPLNPYQFSYRDYMKKLKVESRISLNNTQLVILGEENNLRTLSWEFRERLIAKLQNLKFERDELAVFQALILGQRRDISEQLYKDYAAAGAIHILAISGLHIGILLLLLNFLLKPLERIEYGRIIKPVLVILLLWSFAFLTGLSPSVVRAVCMFSFLAVGLQLKRKTSSLNSFFLSLFFLALLNPYYLFQVGFQLSYLAVFSIIIFQPLLYKLLEPRFKLVDYFWKLTSVSLAAQIGVLPLSIFYFHQFPGLFLATNLVILPFLGLLLILGIAVIVLASNNLLPDLLQYLFSILLRSLNGFVNQIAGMDSFVISGIKLETSQMLALYLFLFSIILLLRKVNFSRLSFTLISILFFQVATLIQIRQIPAYESVIYHRSRHSMITIKNNHRLTVMSDTLVPQQVIEDYKRERRIKIVDQEKLSSVLDLSGKISLVIDTSGNYTLEDFEPEILILRNSAKVNLDRILGSTSPEMIIADGSNYKAYVKRWRETAQNKKIPFHFTGEKGAYFIE